MKIEPKIDNQNVRLEAIVSGDVHGVLYRDHTEKRALELGLVGYCRNTIDGVEVVAEGSESVLADFVKFLWHASPYAEVEDVRYSYKPGTGEFQSFEIRSS